MRDELYPMCSQSQTKIESHYPRLMTCDKIAEGKAERMANAIARHQAAVCQRHRRQGERMAHAIASLHKHSPAIVQRF